MCQIDCNSQEELARLPELIRAQGWLHFPINGNHLIGATGPESNDGGIHVLSGTTFCIEALVHHLEVSVSWPAQSQTHTMVFRAEQAIHWLSKMLPIAEQEYEEHRQRMKTMRESKGGKAP